MPTHLGEPRVRITVQDCTPSGNLRERRPCDGFREVWAERVLRFITRIPTLAIAQARVREAESLGELRFYRFAAKRDVWRRFVNARAIPMR
jgi:hypothetical protein